MRQLRVYDPLISGENRNGEQVGEVGRHEKKQTTRGGSETHRISEMTPPAAGARGVIASHRQEDMQPTGAAAMSTQKGFSRKP
jgi:hypothetical protein